MSTICVCPNCGASHILKVWRDDLTAALLARHLNGETQKSIALSLGLKTPASVYQRFDKFMERWKPDGMDFLSAGIVYRKEMYAKALEAYNDRR